MKLNGRLIAIEPDNKVYVELQIKSIGFGYKPIDFKYDPGADRTAISPNDLLKIGYDGSLVRRLMRPEGSGSSATGENVEHFVIDLNINHILGQIVPAGLKFPFLCMWKTNVALPKPECEGCKLTGEVYGGFRRSLLGNDILSCFEIKTDRSRKNIEFTRISDLTERNKLYYFCEVHELVLGKQ